ncbi:tRNA (adenosine(37)-N6)-threonylcarbamoyltransferase complex transferase subunit TsaD [Candidatus Gottesmanbacteria bacterium]|nr:tRNA (adenosine(37)-N6)-threonylcarbamoyltransferase complex transferase subunit TsaD [Candidatus Gottesmanbacteria bacterium]
MNSHILAIESSCDETAAAVILNGKTILSSSIASSTLVHKKYGGIVPELAAREQIRSIIPVLTEALAPLRTKNTNETYMQTIKRYIDAIAVTIGPGLIGSLLIGIETAKTISFATGIPIIPVNHVIAHMFANFIIQPSAVSRQPSANILEAESKRLIAFPAISLVVSGGHTELYVMKSIKNIQWLGGTLDDAAGEAFDKTARLLGFENRGGAAIQEAASQFSTTQNLKSKIKDQNSKITLPRPYLPDKPYSFSFSGLKTAAVRVVDSLKKQKQYKDETIQQCAYEIQESITDVLVRKTIHAAKIHNAHSILLSGGVASNTRLREKFEGAIQNSGISFRLFAPPFSLCTDNAVTIGIYASIFSTPISWNEITAVSNLSVEI